MKKILPAVVLASLPTLAAAQAPNACELLTVDEINNIAARKVEHIQPQKTGNPSQCGWLDSRKAAVLVVSVREVKYAVRDELFQERDNLEKIYRSRSKQLDTVGDGGYWLAPNKQLGFRKGNLIVNVTFSTPRNQNEVDTAQIARMIETRIKK